MEAGSYKGIPHRVPARNESRLLVEIDVAPQNGVVVCRQHVRQGKSKLVIYASELDELMSRVRTPEHEAALKSATTMFDIALDKHLSEHVGRGWRDAQDEKTKAAVEKAVSRFGDSVWAQFAKLHPTGMPPIISAEILEEVPAPDTAEARADRADGRMEQMLAALVEAVAGRKAKA